MKISYYRLMATLLLTHCFILFRSPLNAQANVNFETGNLNGWNGTWGNGACAGVIIQGQCVGCIFPDPTQYSGLHQGVDNAAPLDSFNHHLMTGGYDANLGGTVLPVVYSPGNYSACLGNMIANGDAESISYSYTLTLANCLFTYHYAVVLNDGGHASAEQPCFKVRVYDANGDSIVSASLDIDATQAATDTNFHSLSPLVYYKPWSSVSIPLSTYIGQTVKITFTTRSCKPAGCSGAHYAYAYIDADVAAVSTGIPSLPTAAANFTLFPNPASNSVTISVDESMIGSTATVTDITGRKAASLLLSTTYNQLSADNFANGIYLVTITCTGGRSATKKLVISK